MYLRAFAIPRLQHAQVKERSRKRGLFPKTYNTFLCPPHLFPDSHSFPTAALHLLIPFGDSVPHNSYGPLPPWPTLPISRTRSSSRRKSFAWSAITSSCRRLGRTILRGCVGFMARGRRRSRCMPRGSSFTALAAAR